MGPDCGYHRGHGWHGSHVTCLPVSSASGASTPGVPTVILAMYVGFAKEALKHTHAKALGERLKKHP